MTRKDYELVADVLAKEYLTTTTDLAIEVRILRSKLAAAFLKDNPKFNPDIFYARCGF